MHAVPVTMALNPIHPTIHSNSLAVKPRPLDPGVLLDGGVQQAIVWEPALPLSFPSRAYR